MRERYSLFARKAFLIISIRFIFCVLFLLVNGHLTSSSLNGNTLPYFTTLNDPSTSLLFFENQYYKITRTNGELYISLQVGDMNVSEEVFPTRASSSNEYTFFQPTSNSPRQFTYFDPNNHGYNGSISIIPYEERGLIVSDDLALDDFFGYRMVINDWNETIISAPGRNSNNGSIYVFNRNSNFELSQDYSLQPITGDEGWWGASLDVAGDYLFIGSPDSSSLSGKLLVYRRSNGVYEKVSEIDDPVSGVAHAFGSAVAADSNGSMVCISPLVTGNRVGRVEVFKRNDTSWNHSQTLWSDNNVTENYFGIDHKIYDDFLIVGSPGESMGGQAYIFTISGDGEWSSNPTVLTTSLSPGDNFGYTVEINESFAFVGAKNGDGNVTDTGVVYIFKQENNAWIEVAKLVPPKGEQDQGFSSDLEVIDDLIVVTSPGVGSSGMAYIYKMHESNASDWRLISTLDNNGSTLLNSQSLPVAASKGFVILGSFEDSSTSDLAGSCKGFYNSAWQKVSEVAVDPLFSVNTPSSFVVAEDYPLGTSYMFQAEHPIENNFTWTVSSVTAPLSQYSQSPEEGNFTYTPEGNFSGVHTFSIQVESIGGNQTRTFDINVTAQPDSPIFDSNQSTEINATWIGEDISFTINVDDADGDSLTISSISLPAGLNITGNILSGVITNDEILGGSTSIDLDINLSVSDGTGTVDATKTFTLKVYARNLPPEIFDQNGNSISSIPVTLPEDFTQSDWLGFIGELEFRDDQTTSGFSIIPTSLPSNGTVNFDEGSTTAPIIYNPNQDFVGSDSFSIDVHDSSVPSKSVALSFTITTTAVNDPPNINSSLIATAAEGIDFAYLIEWEDVDGDIGHEVSVTGLPDWLDFNESSALIYGRPSWSDYKSAADEINLTVTDPDGLSDSKTLLIGVIPINYPPTFYNEDNETRYTDEDVNLRIPLTYYDLSDDPTESVDWQILEEPSFGNLLLNTQGDGAFIDYTPDGNFTGIDQVQIKIFNPPADSNASDTITIPINVRSVEDLPVIGSVPKYNDAVVGYEWSYSYFALDGDENQSVTLSSTTLNASWLNIIDDPDGNLTKASLQGEPTLSDVGTFEITLSAVDSTGLVGTQTFNLNILAENSLPIINEGESLSIEMVEDGFWEKQNPLTCTDQNKQRLNWSVITEPSNGEVIITTDGDVLSHISYIPAENFHGNDFVTIEVSDGIDSDEFTYYFTILSAADTPVFSSRQNGTLVSQIDGNLFQEWVTFTDGDNDINRYEVISIPDWLSVNDSNFTLGELYLSGVPSVDDEGVSLFEVRIIDLTGLSSSLSFDIEVVVHNYPPEISFDEENLELDEDQGLTKLGELTVSDRDHASGHLWSIIDGPDQGEVSFSETADSLAIFYTSSKDYNGEVTFTVRVDDNGTANGNPKSDEISLTLHINQVEDNPAFLTSPPKEAYEDQNFTYQFEIWDGDMPKDELSVTVSKLPHWIIFEDQGQGVGKLYGNPRVSDAGLHRVTINATDLAGNTTEQTFLLNLIVRDFPPVFKSIQTSTVLDNIILYLKEDEEMINWTNPKGFMAVNPDPESDDFAEINWSIARNSTQGSILSVGGAGGKPSLFRYIPPTNFSGLDYFSLVMDEGDRITEIDFEIRVSEVPDPPYFVSALQSSYILNEGDPFELEVLAADVDSNEIQCRIVGPSWETNPWLRVDEGNETGQFFLRGVPQVGVNGKVFPYTLVLIDDTGLIANKGVTFDVNGANSPPEIIPSAVQIIFNQDGLPISNYDSIRAIDLDGEVLKWSMVRKAEYTDAEIVVEGNGALPTFISFSPKAIKPKYEKFEIEVTDGVSSDSVVIEPFVNWDHNLTVSGLSEAISIKETQGFSQMVFVNSSNKLADIKVEILEGPAWVTLSTGKNNDYQISGVAPIGSSGTYKMILRAEGEETVEEFNFAIDVIDGRIPKLVLKGDPVVKISSMEPFQEYGFIASDARGIDISSEVKVTTGATDNFGYSKLEYEVSDVFKNKAYAERLIKEYRDNALVFDEYRMKFLGEAQDYIWGQNNEIEIVSSAFRVMGINGVETEDVGTELSSWVTLSSDFSTSRINAQFSGENVRLMKIASCSEVTYIAGHFSHLLTVSSKRVSSDFIHNAFLAAFSNNGELVWVKTIGAPTPLSNLCLLTTDSNEAVLAGSCSSGISFDDNTDLLESNETNFFVCKFSVTGDLSQNSSVPLIPNSKMTDFKSFGNENYIALLESQAGGTTSIHFTTIDKAFGVLNEFSFDSNESISVNDFEFSKDKFFIGGDFSGTFSSESQLIFSSTDRSAYIISTDESGSISWARHFPGSGVSSIRDIEIDYWGDLLVAQEFTGKRILGTSTLEAQGGYDLQLSLFNSGDGGGIWDKHIAGDGNETINSLKLNAYGAPVLFFQTSLGLYQDDVAFSPTTANEIHGVKILPETGSPVITTEKLEIDSLGSFSFQLNALHPEYLFFEIKSGPSWMELREVDGANGTAKLAGNTRHLLLEDIENIEDLEIAVYTIDGAYTEKKIEVIFTQNDQLEKDLGLLPTEHNSSIIFNRNSQFSHIEEFHGYGWVVAGSFAEEFNELWNYNYKLKLLSEELVLSEIISIYSESPVHLSDLKVSNAGTVILYGSFSNSVNIGSKILTSRGSTDLFITEVDRNGNVIRIKQLGHSHSEKAGGIVVNEENLIICGSFESSTRFGFAEYTAKGNSRDGFVAQINRLNFSDIKWVTCVGESGNDYASDIVSLNNNQSMVGIVGEVDTELSTSSKLSNAKMVFRLIQLDSNGSFIKESNYFSSGRINNGLLTKAPTSSLVVFSFEFEKELSWASGHFNSNGGFDIFNSSIENGLLSTRYSRLGGPWNDRLTTLASAGINSYVVASNFHQNIEVGSKSFEAMGSSDALITKLHSESHQLIDDYHLSTVKEDRIDVLNVFSDQLMIVCGKTYSVNTKAEQSFLDVYGKKSINPRVLNDPPNSLNLSFPFDFTLYSESWSVQNGTFVVSSFDEEENYDWINVEVDDYGNVRFYGITPNFDAIIPFDFSIKETQSLDTLNINFNLVLSSEGNVLPEVDIPKEIVIFEGEHMEVDFNVFDLDGDDVELEIDGPTWITIQRDRDNEGRSQLIIDKNNSAGEFNLKIFASDRSSESTVSKVKLVIKIVEEEQNNEGGNSEKSSSFMENRLDFENGWSFHYRLGWLFIDQVDQNSLWLWKEGRGWLWTENSLWENEISGYFYRSDNSSWVFWTENGPTKELNTYDFKNKTWSEF